MKAKDFFTQEWGRGFTKATLSEKNGLLEMTMEDIYSTMEKYAKLRLSLWFKVVIQGKKEIKGYKYREVGNLPIVGVHHFEGYEIINPTTNKVLYRKVKDWGTIGSSSSDYSPSVYNTVSKFFPQNAL